MLTSILIILISSIVIYYFGKHFAIASSEIGDYLNLSKSVKGATLDAVASSFPELMISVFSVIFFKQFSVGVGVIAGSVFFNILMIPALAVLVSPVTFRVSKEVMSRDGLFQSISIFIFLMAILYSQGWGLTLSVILLTGYVVYMLVILESTKEYQIKHKKRLGQKISVFLKSFIALFSMVVMGFASYFITKHAIFLANILGIHPIVVGFSIIAVATSLPEMVIGIINSKKGHTDDILSNVLGSNIFNILIAIGLPLFIYSILYTNPVRIITGGFEIVAGLIFIIFFTGYLIMNDGILSKKEAILMILSYFSFSIYLIHTTF